MKDRIGMETPTAEQLATKKCLPCEGGVDACSLDYSNSQLTHLPHWRMTADGKWIRRSIRLKNFLRTLACVNQIGELAETEAHHPDLHITGYRNLAIELTTHAIGGLSENDFILASKIDRILATDFPEIKNNE
jgi:4a-hydroxytetrahydrobiopterin dehydratase